MHVFEILISTIRILAFFAHGHQKVRHFPFVHHDLIYARRYQAALVHTLQKAHHVQNHGEPHRVGPIYITELKSQVTEHKMKFVAGRFRTVI